MLKIEFDSLIQDLRQKLKKIDNDIRKEREFMKSYINNISKEIGVMKSYKIKTEEEDTEYLNSYKKWKELLLIKKSINIQINDLKLRFE